MLYLSCYPVVITEKTAFVWLYHTIVSFFCIIYDNLVNTYQKRGERSAKAQDRRACYGYSPRQSHLKPTDQ